MGRRKTKTEGERGIPGYDLLILVCKIYESECGMTTREMAAAIGISEKQATRHINDLTRFTGFVESDQKRDRLPVYSFNKIDFDTSPIAEGLFSMFDLLGFATIRDFYEQHPETSIPLPIRKALNRIESKMTDEMRENYKKMHRFYVNKRSPVSDYSKKTHVIEGLLHAVRSHKVVEIDYSSENSRNRKNRKIHPYLMMSSKGSLYVVAFDPSEKRSPKIKKFKIDRIHSLKGTQTAFQPDFDFDMIKQLSSGFGIYTGPRAKVTAVFERQVATLLREQKHHESQVLEELPEGRVKASWDLDVTIELKSWLLSFGPQVEILEPQSLRDEIRKDLMRMNEIYHVDQLASNPANVAVTREPRNIGESVVTLAR